VSPDQTDWDDHLAAAEFAINNAWQKSVQETPFMLNYGQHPNTPLRLLVEANQRVPAASNFVEQITAGVAKARECILRAQDRYASYANKSRKDVTFAVNDMVMLHTKNIKMTGARKLLPRWLGPFRISQVINPVAFRLVLPRAMRRLHDVFHVGLLKPYHADAARATFRPFVPELSDEYGPILEVERILDHRDVKPTRGGKGGRARKHREYLVKWHGCSQADTTWEPEENLVGAADDMLTTYRKSIGKVLLDRNPA
jgi:hypothetical protein